MSDDLVKRLSRLALMAETANHWTDEHRLMPAPGVADIVYEAADRIKELEAELLETQDRANAFATKEYYTEMRAERAEAKLAKAVEERLDAIHTLDAWFDRRKLAHDAVDQAVVDVASGYLRTSRVGGMPQEESDLILGVIQDMARLSVFADLFARTTLAELKGETND